jgi:3-oxoacyl-[acyl-carrier protein] reductase
MEFKDKNVFVTGGTRGIGLSIAKSFASNGANVIINGRKEPEFNLSDFSIKAFYKFDISDFSATNDNINRMIEELGGVDVLVNNAGLTRDSLFLKMNETMWDETINANLKGAFNVTKALTKQFMKKRSGSIINISSVVGQTGNIGQANYVATKAGLIGLTKALALEFAVRGVRVNAVSPGFIETSMTESIPEEMKNSFLNKIPLKAFGKPEDVASAVLFLASERARYITGQVLNVNGGMYM